MSSKIIVDTIEKKTGDDVTLVGNLDVPTSYKITGTDADSIQAPGLITSAGSGLNTSLNTALNSATLGTGTTFPAGHVLQVVSTTKTDFFSTTSTTYVDVTGLSATITPSSTSSKILVSVTGAASGSAQNSFAYAVLLRDSTQIAIGDSRGSAQRATLDLAQQQAGTVTVWAKHFAIHHLDSPSTTSATTYKLQVKCTINSVGIGGTWTTSDGNRSNVPTVITLMEIAG